MTAKEKSELMRESRKRRKEMGLVEFRTWCTEQNKKKLEALDKKLKEN